jgi:aminoglycoside phosphotransferase (APT) family kinase protein
MTSAHREGDDGAVRTPVAEAEIDDALVERLLRAQHPDLAGPLRRVANGWDNVIYRLGDELCVRLPRREVAVALIRNEQRWLPHLAGRVGVPIPVPVRVGAPGDGYPWPWSVNPWLAGTPAADLPVAARAGFARELAGFFAALHAPADPEAPENPVRGVSLQSRSAAVARRLATGLVPHADRLGALWAALVATPPWSGPPLWLHGDPHPANILTAAEATPATAAQATPAGAAPNTPRGPRLAAVIDFGDLTGGDPATDLAAGWLVFDGAGREAFHAELDARGAVDPQTWARARGWALCIATSLATSSADNPAMAAIAAHTIKEVVSA